MDEFQTEDSIQDLKSIASACLLVASYFHIPCTTLIPECLLKVFWQLVRSISNQRVNAAGKSRACPRHLNCDTPRTTSVRAHATVSRGLASSPKVGGLISPKAITTLKLI